MDGAVRAALWVLRQAELASPTRAPLGRRARGLMRAKVTGLVFAGTLVGTSGMAAAGVLPAPVQDAAARALSAVGIHVPVSHPTLSPSSAMPVPTQADPGAETSTDPSRGHGHVGDNGQADQPHGQSTQEHGHADDQHGQSNQEQGHAQDQRGQSTQEHGHADEPSGQPTQPQGQSGQDHGQPDPAGEPPGSPSGHDGEPPGSPSGHEGDPPGSPSGHEGDPPGSPSGHEGDPPGSPDPTPPGNDPGGSPGSTGAGNDGNNGDDGNNGQGTPVGPSPEPQLHVN